MLMVFVVFFNTSDLPLQVRQPAAAARGGLHSFHSFAHHRRQTGFSPSKIMDIFPKNAILQKFRPPYAMRADCYKTNLQQNTNQSFEKQ
ncbi:hypothetical protein LJC45_03360 [Alistipes sp. OttesenSCG-928-B03]|nr:hypothetical protein [Alistipes sp. OttesenSCG-928-B03]